MHNIHVEKKIQSIHILYFESDANLRREIRARKYGTSFIALSFIVNKIFNLRS